MEFKKHKLGEFIDTISETSTIKKQQVVLINTSDVENGKVLNHKYTENKNLKGQFKKRFRKDDILYSEIRPKNKRFAYVDFDASDYIASTKLMVLRNKGNIDNTFLYQLLKSNKIINQLQLLAESRSGTFPQITFNELANVEIEIPNIENQIKISKILTDIDSKIEINNQTNDNLFKMMKIKFEDWITNLNKYEVSSLSKIANYTNGLAMQKFRPKDNEESLPVIKIKEMNDGITENTERCSTNIKDEVIINDGDVLFAWSGTLCMSIWGKGKAGLNQHIFKVTSDKYPKWFYYFWTLKHLNKFKMIAAGKATTMGHIKRGELDISEVLIPEDKELQEMHKIMQPLFNKYINNLIQNETLTQLRDTLLPKLMNGEIDLDKIEN